METSRGVCSAGRMCWCQGHRVEVRRNVGRKGSNVPASPTTSTAFIAIPSLTTTTNRVKRQMKKIQLGDRTAHIVRTPSDAQKLERTDHSVQSQNGILFGSPQHVSLIAYIREICAHFYSRLMYYAKPMTIKWITPMGFSRNCLNCLRRWTR